MKRKIALNHMEYLISEVSGLIASFDGMHNFYFGDLLLTNMRLYLVAKGSINVEVSMWFEDETKDINQSELIVGNHSLKILWASKGNTLNFIENYQDLN